MTQAFKVRRRPSDGRPEYEIAPGRWVSRQRLWQLRKAHGVGKFPTLTHRCGMGSWSWPKRQAQARLMAAGRRRAKRLAMG